MSTIATSTNGHVYEIDPDTHKCKKILSVVDVEDVIPTEVGSSLPMYRQYLKDTYNEDCAMKKGKLFFRGYRISLTQEGLLIEDTQRKYRVVETPFEGLPSLQEFGDFFKAPTKVVHTDEELKRAVALGKLVPKETDYTDDEEDAIDFEKLRKQTLHIIGKVKDGTLPDFDPMSIPNMIPFKKWKRKVNTILKQWRNKEIRYKKALNLIESVTIDQLFEVEIKKPAVTFVGTILPEFKFVGSLKGNKIMVDDKWLDAAPFLMNWILYFEPKAMPQIMRYANGEIDEETLLNEPFLNDGSIEYNKRALENTQHNAQVMSALCVSLDIYAPQELVYDEDLTVGDTIRIFYEDSWRVREIINIDEEGTFFKGCKFPIIKTDKYYKITVEQDDQN